MFGLASGYYAFGKITERKWERFLLLKIYGYTELLTALYIGIFPIYFPLLRDLSFQSPAHFFSDILVSLLALFLPTFLMGASIPVLTAVLPEKAQHAGYIHARIYGWNTLGAFFGTLVAGFFLIPKLGFALTLAAAAWLNLAAALIFVGNKLKGTVSYKPDSFSTIPSLTPNGAYMAFVFWTGAVVISFEILFVRILNLSIGSGIYNFPMVLSLFVGSLALGSLSLKDRQVTPAFFIQQIFINVFLMGLIYMSAPYWSSWISHIRVSLSNISSNYYVFKLAVYLFLACFIVPAVFFMGRLLPLAYALLKKTKENYGSVCGFLYFSNTLGTVFGTIVIGYLAFYIFNLDDLFKINLFILLSLIFTLAFFERKRFAMTVAILTALLLTFLPGWNRSGHYMGYFRTRAASPWHFKGLFHLPRFGHKKILYFKDGPNSTVTFLAPAQEESKTDESSEKKELSAHKDKTHFSKKAPTASQNENKKERTEEENFKSWAEGKANTYSIIVNGKSDGDTKGDFSTVVLLGSLPYMFAPEGENLLTAVIGLGTGITAGVMGHLKDIKETVVLEISPKAIKGIHSVSDSGYYNFQVTANPKVKFVEQDAFKYFVKNKTLFDIIVSEPPNPWVVGVENLFSKEFYHMIAKSLSEGGVLSQWLHTYSMNQTALGMIIKTIRQEFEYVQMYQIHGGDLMFLASRSPLSLDNPKRFKEPLIHTIHEALGLSDFNDISLLQIFGQKRLASLSQWLPVGLHTLHVPKLTYQADRAFFIGQGANAYQLSPDYFTEDKTTETQKTKAFEKYSRWTEEDIIKKCKYKPRFNFYCRLLLEAVQHKKNFEDKKKPAGQRVFSYIFLRKRGLLKHQESFMAQLKEAFLKEQEINTQTLLVYVNHLLSQKDFQRANQDIQLFKEKSLLNKDTFESMEKHIQKVQTIQQIY